MTLEKSDFVHKVYSRLKKKFGKVDTPLHYSRPYELAIAVILSAQCTDEQVNKVTPALFAEFVQLSDYYSKPISKLEKLIHSTGFYHNKAKHIRGFARMLDEKFGGKLPEDLSSLIQLPGFGRKTANVVQQVLYHKAEGIVVDTHVARISKILQLTESKNAVIIERDLMKKIPSSYWIDWSLYMIYLGRSSCTAKKRFCESCVLMDICPCPEQNI